MENKNTLKVSRESLIFAFRYSLGRESYAPRVITDDIKSNIENIDNGTIELFIREIKDCEHYGMNFDKTHWLNFKTYLENILEKRK